MLQIVIIFLFLVAVPMEVWAKRLLMDDGTYNGSVRRGQPSGQGTINYNDGRIFAGNFSKGSANGQGILTRIDGSYTEGNWKNGRLDGLVKRLLANGAHYSGTYKNGKLNGNVLYTFLNGDVYDGPFENSEISGRGTLRKADGDIYTGLLLKGKPDGLGTYYDAQDYSTFNGFFTAGAKDGAGSMEFPNGRSFKGFWDNDRYLDPSCSEYTFDLLVVADSVAATLDFDVTRGTSSCKR